MQGEPQTLNGKYPRYPEYKESGQGWLREIPESWDCQLGRRVFAQTRLPAFASDVQLSATQKYGVIPQNLFMEREDQKVVLALGGIENFKHVDKDDFVISLRSFQGGIERCLYDGCVSPAYTILHAKSKIDAGYYAYLMKSPDYIGALQSVTDGIRDGKNISYEQFGVISVPIPSRPEQQAIAAFLDRETAKIDTLIEKQERLIALLGEKRQAVISHAVTKGLYPNAPMKESGVEWLGEVPAHWDIKRLKYLITRIEQGFSPQCENYPADEENWGVLKVGCVNGVHFNPDEQKALPPGVVPETQYEICTGDVLMSRANTTSLIGMASLVEKVRPRLLLSDKIYRFHPLQKIADSAFLVTALRSDYVRWQIQEQATGASPSMQNIAQQNIRELVICSPPLVEQRDIVNFIRQEAAKIACIAAKANQSIALMKEHRAALISAAVTGKIDVRGLAA